MAVPVELEIFIKNSTNAGLQSVENNVSNVENQTKQLIAALQQVIAEQKKQLEANRAASQDYTQEAANIQALTGRVRELEAGLKSLQKAKKETTENKPKVDIDTTEIDRKTNYLKLQFAQVARELPSLAMGPQMFILAISNNFPMLMEAIANVRKENELLTASGKKAVPVWKQLASSVFSWQTALVAAISLGIVFGKDIMDWVSKITKGKDAALSLADAQKKVNEAFEKDSGNVGEQTVRIRSLSEQWKKLGDNLEDKKRFIKENKDELDKLGVSVGNVNDAENLLAKNTEQYIQAMSLRAQAASAFKLATEAAETAIKKQVQINQEEKKSPSFMDRFLSVLSGTGASSTWSSRSTEEATAEQRQQTRINGMKEEKKAAEETEKAYTELFTTLSNQAKKVLNDAGISESDNKEETKIAKTDYASQLADARVKAQQTTEKLRLQIMMEGIAKRKALAKQEYDEQLADIDKQERDTLAKMDKARKQGDNIPQSQYDSVKQEAQTQRILAEQVLNKKLLDIDNEYQNKAIEAQITYNKQYGTYAEQRAAIIAEGLRKAAKAENDGSRKLILRQTEDALKQLDFKRFKDSINFADVFSNLDTQTTGALKILRDKLKEYINNAAGELGPEDLKELQDAFQKIDFKIAERDPFGELKTGLKEYKSAQESVNKAQKDLDTVMQGGAVITGMYMDENGKLISRLLSVEQAEKNLSEAQSNRQQVLTKLTAAANSIGTQGLQVVNVGSQIVDMLGSFGIKMPEAVSNTLNGLGQVMSGLESIDLTKPFSAITGSLDILTGIGNTISGLLGFGGADYSGYEEMKSRYEGLIDIWDTLIDKKTQYIDIDYGVEAQKAAEEAIKLTETQIQRQRQLALKLNDSGRSMGSHSMGVRVAKNMNQSDWQRLSSLVGQQVGSMSDVLNLDADIIGKVLQDEHFVSVLTTVNTEFIDYIQNIGEYAEQLEEIAEKEKEAITGIGFDAFKDGYIDMLSDLSSSNEDFADNFEKQLQNAIFRSLIANKYTSQIQNLYDEWVRLGEDGLTQSEVDYLRNLQQNLTDKLVQERENMKELFGWESEDKESTDTAIEGLEELQRAYEKLSEASSKAFSSEAVKILKQQNENLNEQISLIRKRIDEENRSANPDTDYLDELKGQLEDINAQIEDNKEAMKDAIFGEDIQSAISNFVSAYTEALGDGGSMQKMSKDFIESMVQNMVTESIKADSSPIMENIREKLIEAWKDGVVTADEQLSIEEIVNNLNKELSDKYGWAEGLFGESDIEGLEALQDAYDKLSDSVSETYSSEKAELLKQQSEILRQQRDLILERLEAEKALGERGDASLVNEWEEQLEEVNSKIEENKKSQLDAIFGQETQTQISNLANALIDVWSGAKKQADSAKDFINGIIKSMVLESLMLDLTPFIDSLREQMAEMFEDGIISADEGDALAGMVEGVMNSLEKQYEWADRFIKEEEEVVQTVEEVKESLTGLTLDSFTDSFVSGLADMSKSYKDMCDDFEDSLRNSILKGLVESQYKNRITALYNMWERAAESEGQITDKEAEQLRYEYQQIIQDLMKQRDEMAQDFGWANTTDQSPSSGALTTMSQDSIAAFEGIGRNMQTHLANMDRYVQELRETQKLDSETLATIASHTAYIVLIYDLMEDMKLNGIKMQ